MKPLPEENQSGNRCIVSLTVKIALKFQMKSANAFQISSSVDTLRPAKWTACIQTCRESTPTAILPRIWFLLLVTERWFT
jgi:hypothetical protein